MSVPVRLLVDRIELEDAAGRRHTHVRCADAQRVVDRRVQQREHRRSDHHLLGCGPGGEQLGIRQLDAVEEVTVRQVQHGCRNIAGRRQFFECGHVDPPRFVEPDRRPIGLHLWDAGSQLRQRQAQIGTRRGLWHVTPQQARQPRPRDGRTHNREVRQQRVTLGGHVAQRAAVQLDPQAAEGGDPQLVQLNRRRSA